MSEVKQVKVDNWGSYFLQRLKHFFNRTDYCDLTLQFQDNAQLKVHRLVLNACTEYFELLERTCEMYEDCLVMPDDLQADVVVPIVNFMYTGQLEFPMDLLEKLYQTSEIMNLTILTKLLDHHRSKYNQIPKIHNSYPPKRAFRMSDSPSEREIINPATSTKRSYSKAFDKKTVVLKDKKLYQTTNKRSLAVTNKGVLYRPPSPIPLDTTNISNKVVLGEPRPTRYELPEELDTDNVFENSFSNISYTSQPLMVHPETRKQYSKRRRNDDPSTSKRLGATSTIDIVDCKPVSKVDHIFDERISDDCEVFSHMVKVEPPRDPSQLFDQILDHDVDLNQSKVTIETAKPKKFSTANMDHAKIISEVLKKYPHLVKSNKNIKLKILNTPAKNVTKRQYNKNSTVEKSMTLKKEPEQDYTYETDVLDSKQAAKLIALGAENIEGPWICLICGTPGKALHFTSYYNYRRHLVEVHHEKPILTICEYCGQKLQKRNYLVYHMYTKHGVEPPSNYNFPKCNQCDYVGLNEALLVKHKMSHSGSKNPRYLSISDSIKTSDGKYQCHVCQATFYTPNKLMIHIEKTGHKKQNKTCHQCSYCMKSFSREYNLYAHMKIQHKTQATRDGIIDDSEDESPKEDRSLKCGSLDNDYEEVDIQYQIQQRPDGNIHIIPKKTIESPVSNKRKILNPGFSGQSEKPTIVQKELIQDTMPTVEESHEGVVMIDGNEYILRGNKLIPKKAKQDLTEYILPNIMNDTTEDDISNSTSIAYTNVQNTNENIQQTNVILKNATSLAQSIPVYVSNEEEYKAIMSSNHPILLDTGNTNKTLTVLTAPHAGSLDTTSIDLDNTQSNDMMIIQDNYNNLNVSEAVSTNNANIVVVYSDQLNNRNKEYELITTQGLQPQFVQSSAIITQNYETVTTTTPVMSAHVLGAQVEGVWQGNQVTIQQHVEHQNVEIANETQLQQAVQSKQITISNGNNSNININELQQVSIIPNTTASEVVQIVPSTANQIVQIVPNTSQPEQVVQIIPSNSTPNSLPANATETVTITSASDSVPSTSQSEPEMVQSTEDSNSTPHEDSKSNSAPEVNEDQFITLNDINNANQMSSDNQTSNTIPEAELQQVDEISEISEVPQIQSEVTQAEPVSVDSNNTEIEHFNEQQMVVNEQEPDINETSSQDPEDVQQQTEAVVEERVEETPEEHIELNNDEKIVQSQDVVEDIHTAETQQIVEETLEDTDFITLIPTNEGVHSEVVDTSDKIQTLTSEWSEEDSEVASQNLENEVHEQTIQGVDEDTLPELEESIENIQQEVVKHMREARLSTNNDASYDGVENQSMGDVPNQEPEKNEKIVPPEVKISSLLNDWEDNDSHEEICNEVENNDLVKDSVTNTATENNLPQPNEVIVKEDNIKKLVSDWDDDEEENK